MIVVSDSNKSSIILPSRVSSLNKSYKQAIADLFATHSLKIQISDCRYFKPIPFRVRILTGAFPRPEAGESLSKPFNGTCQDLINQVADSIHLTINNLNYNGLWPYLKVLDQFDKGKSFEEFRVDGQNEGSSSTCVGMSHTILKNLKEEHDIEGALAVQRRSYMHPFEHAAVIVECTDGFVLLDARADPSRRIYSIPFESTKHYQGFMITASKRGSGIPLTVTYEKCGKNPEISFEYCINVANGADLVLKHFVMETISSFIPLSCYYPNGSTRKYILVVPQESKIVFKDTNTSKEKRTETIYFKSILEDKFLAQLKNFMAPNYCSTVPTFQVSVELVHQQLVTFVSQEERIKRLLKKTNLFEVL